MPIELQCFVFFSYFLVSFTLVLHLHFFRSKTSLRRKFSIAQLLPVANMPSRFNKFKGKVHFATIAEDDWTDLSQKKCFFFGKKYGVSGRAVWEQVRSGNLTNRTFPVVQIVPHLITKEELLGDREELLRIVRERELNGLAVDLRRYKLLHTQRQDAEDEEEESSESEAEPCEIPPTPPQPAIHDALTRVYATRTSPCFGLHLLATVQDEDAAAAAAGHDAAGVVDVAVRARLQRLPMSVLHNFISELWQVRRAWERALLAPSAAAVAAEQAHTEDEKINALLYHVCLWQRRYPLKLLLSILSFHAAHREVFLPTSAADACETYRVEQLLEELQRLHFPDLSDVPGLIRCDVLMTYPKLPLEEQVTLMRSVTAACQRRTPAPPAQRTDSTLVGEGTEDAAALHAHSRVPPNPQFFLQRFVPAGVVVQPRYCSGMSRDAYREMRAAVERHKQDGVRRLALQDYPPVPQAPSAT